MDVHHSIILINSLLSLVSSSLICGLSPLYWHNNGWSFSKNVWHSHTTVFPTSCNYHTFSNQFIQVTLLPVPMRLFMKQRIYNAWVYSPELPKVILPVFMCESATTPSSFTVWTCVIIFSFSWHILSIFLVSFNLQILSDLDFGLFFLMKKHWHLSLLLVWSQHL